MRIESLQAVQVVPASPGEAWVFFSDPRNLARITPPSLGIRITSPVPERMHPGMIITYSVRALAGIRAGWVTEITHVREPDLFVDEQRFGPYRFWHHQHLFRPVAGGVEVRDVVHYALPFGLPGRLAGGPIVRRRLREIFAFRRRALEEIFGRPVAA